MFILYIVQFLLYLIRPHRYTASTQKMVDVNCSSHWLFNIASKGAESQINMWPAEQNLAHPTFWRNCDNFLPQNKFQSDWSSSYVWRHRSKCTWRMQKHVNSIFDINTACQLFCVLSVLCIFHCEYRNTVSRFDRMK